MGTTAYNQYLEDCCTRTHTAMAQNDAAVTPMTADSVTPALSAECCAFLTRQAALILAPSKDPASDHQLVLDVMQSMPHRDPNTFQFILAVNFAYLIVQMILTGKMND